MKRTLTLALLASTAMILTGCMSDKQWEDTRKMHAAYMRQPRSYDAVALRGTNMTVTITGAAELVMQAPLNPLTVIPQAPEVVKDVVDGIVRVGTVAGATYVGAELVNEVGGDTINNAAAVTP